LVHGQGPLEARKVCIRLRTLLQRRLQEARSLAVRVEHTHSRNIAVYKTGHTVSMLNSTGAILANFMASRQKQVACHCFCDVGEEKVGGSSQVYTDSATWQSPVNTYLASNRGVVRGYGDQTGSNAEPLQNHQGLGPGRLAGGVLAHQHGCDATRTFKRGILKTSC